MGLGRGSLGLRVLRSATEQSLGSLATPSAATVRSTSWEAIARVRAASIGQTDFLATAGGGLLHLGYAPDQAQVQAGGGATLAVELAPVDEWTASAGLALERALIGPWLGSIAADYRFFSMETAHRSGSEIVRGAESFGGFSVRLGLAWRHGI